MPLTYILASDVFTGGDDAEIDGRTPDGGGDPSKAVGAWTKHPAYSGMDLAILAGKLVGLNCDYGIYSITGIPSMPAEQAGEFAFQLPATEGVGVGPKCTYYGSGVQAGSTNPTTVPEDTGHQTYALFFKWTGGAGFAEVSTTLSDGTFVKSRFEVDSSNNRKHVVTYTDNVGTVHTDVTVLGSTGPMGSPTQYCHQVGIDINVSQVSHESPGSEFTHFRPTSVTIGTPTYSYGGSVVPDLYGPVGTTGGGESGYIEVLLLEDPTDETNYALGMDYNHGGGGIVANLTLYLAQSGGYRILRWSNGHTLVHDETTVLRAEIDAAGLITCTLSSVSLGTVSFTFDTATEVSDDDGLSVPLLTSGDVGLTDRDDSCDGSYLRGSRFTVYGPTPSTGPVLDPCTDLVSAHDFFAPARPDIDGTNVDTFPGLGTWLKHPESTAVVASDGSEGWVVGAGRAIYLDTGIAGQVGGVPTPLGNEQTSDVIARFPTGGGDAAYEALILYDDTDDSGYGFRLASDGTATLFKRVAGVETEIGDPIGVVTVDPDTDYHIRIGKVGSLVAAVLDDVEMAVATDTTFTSGTPGFAAVDENEDGTSLRLQQFLAYSCDDTVHIDPPCEGPPEHPYPEPQPPGGGGPPSYGYSVMKSGMYRFVPLPTAEALNEFTQARRNLANRIVSPFTGTPPETFGVRKNLAYRFPKAAETDGGDDDTGSPWPPNYDPCEIAPPTEDPPDVVIGAPPARLFFAWAITPTQIGPLWTATFQSMGTSIVTAINQAAARGGAIFATPGDKSKFLRGGRYDPNLMDAWIYGMATPSFVNFILDAQDAGSFAGVHEFDDWENPQRWPPTGISFAEMNRVAAVWKNAFTDGTRQIRVMLRARSDQLHAAIPNLDGLISQARFRGSMWDSVGHSAYNYAYTELSYCQARGWILHLSQNVYEGPQQGVTISAAEVLANGLAWCDAVNDHPWGGKCYGQGMWQFAPRRGQDATTPPYLNSYAGWRNAVAALGPPS